MRVAQLARTGIVACAALLAAALVLPATSLAVAEKEYATTFTAECVVGPGILNTKSTAKVAISAKGPTEVFHGEEGMFHGAHSTITVPAALAEEFVLFGANEVKGKATNFVLEGSGGEPSMLNIAKPAEYPEGLPFISPVEKGKEGVFAIPSLALNETGLTYSFGPEKVTATSGILKVLVSSAKGFVETEKGVYKATGEGLVTSVEGLKSGSRVVSPIPVDCTAPPNVVAAEIPVVTATPLSEGHPEFFDNFVGLTSTHKGIVGWGPVKFASPNLETEIECLNYFFGGVWNEGSPSVGHGQILGWTGTGDATSTGTSLNRECKFKKGTAVVEAWMSDEPGIGNGGRTASTKLTVPWNAELRCGGRAGEEVAILKIGIPNGAPSSTGCVSEAAEKIAVEKEETESRGCYESPVPEGCIKVSLVQPALGLEEEYEGTLRPAWTNGFGNGLNASTQAFEGATSGHLRLATTFATTATLSGQYKLIGYSASELIEIK